MVKEHTFRREPMVATDTDQDAVAGSVSSVESDPNVLMPGFGALSEKLASAMAERGEPTASAPQTPDLSGFDTAEPLGPSPRRNSRRRSAGPARGQIAANDDGPSISGLIHALEQQPSAQPLRYAVISSAAWAAIGLAYLFFLVMAALGRGESLQTVLTHPTTFVVFAVIVVPIAVIYFLALLASRADELRLRSSAMTEVAVRLAEPDRMAGQSIVSLGQSVREQVSYMDEAVLQALGRASELEVLVNSEVATLQTSYEENERKIRKLIKELTSERQELLTTSERVAETLRSFGNEVPALIEKLSGQQINLSQIIEGAGENLANLESAITNSTERLQLTLGSRTEHLQTVLTDYMDTMGGTFDDRTNRMQAILGEFSGKLVAGLDGRTEHMQMMLDDYSNTVTATMSGVTQQVQAVLEDQSQNFAANLSDRARALENLFQHYAHALDSTLAARTEALDVQVVDRTRALEAAFSENLKLFDQSIKNSAQTIDSRLNEKTLGLTSALDQHVKSFAGAVDRQAIELEDTLMRGINMVRRSSENITVQSVKAIEGLSQQSSFLQNVSENTLSQINSVTDRFETQGQTIMLAASALEQANEKIDSTLQVRHADLNHTINQLTGKADEFNRFISNYSTTIEGSLTEAERRARSAAEQLKLISEDSRRSVVDDIQRMQAVTGTESARALEDFRQRFSMVSSEMSKQIGTMSARVDESSAEIRQRAARTATEIAEEERRMRDKMERMPSAVRENADIIRRAIDDKTRAMDALSSLAARTAATRDVMPPQPAPTPLTNVYTTDTRSSGLGAGNLNPNSFRSSPPTGAPSRLSDLVATAMPQSRSGVAGLGLPTPPSGTERWSFGDLLSAASGDDDPYGSSQQQGGGADFAFDVSAIARAIDPSTASAVWSQLQNGQQGVMGRNIYTLEGRALFDEISHRYRADSTVQNKMRSYLVDFEKMIQDADRQDPTRRTTQSYLLSDSGRVYLFMAHVCGRLS